jgi:hypothetical protein
MVSLVERLRFVIGIMKMEMELYYALQILEVIRGAITIAPFKSMKMGESHN